MKAFLKESWSSFKFGLVVIFIAFMVYLDKKSPEPKDIHQFSFKKIHLGMSRDELQKSGACLSLQTTGGTEKSSNYNCQLNLGNGSIMASVIFDDVGSYGTSMSSFIVPLPANSDLYSKAYEFLVADLGQPESKNHNGKMQVFAWKERGIALKLNSTLGIMGMSSNPQF